MFAQTYSDLISMLRQFCFFFFVLLFNFSVAIQASEIIVEPDQAIESKFDYFEDPSGLATIEDVFNQPETNWQHAEQGSANFGMTQSSFWLRFAVRNLEEISQNFIAELNYSQLDSVQFYVFLGKSNIHRFDTGDAQPFYPREVDHPNMLLRFNLASEQIKTIYVRVQTSGSMILPLNVWREDHFYESVTQAQKLHFFYYGSLAVIILINFAVFLTLREKLYLYYALAISGYLLFFASMLSFSFQHLYPQYPALHSRALLVSMPILAFFSVLFCREFLQTQAHSPKLDLGLKAIMYFEIFNIISALVFSYNVAIMISAISAFFFFSILFVAGPISWKAGQRAGAFFTIAWLPLTLGVLATAGRSLGIFPENFITQYGMQLGSGLEAFILTLALADRLYREREQKIKAQADSLLTEKARNETHKKLTEAMMHDPVTGLPNRNRFENIVNQVLQQNPNGQYMVGVARITRLDEINRTLGLTRSENLLKFVAQQMTSLAQNLPAIYCTKEANDKEALSSRQARVYQLSGDCFGIFLNPENQTDNFKAIEKALRKLTEAVVVDGLAIDLHPKFGAARFPQHGDNAALLIRNAHVGMEITPHTKQEVGLYSPDYDIYSESRLTLMSDLREALLHDKTELYYQPKICLKTGKILSLEALIRWHHPERSWIYPDEFIPLAEDTGVITELTRWAFERGLKELATLHKTKPELCLSINISARDLVSGQLEKVIKASLGMYNIDPKSLVIELTETAAMEDPEKGLNLLNKLTDMGLKVSIDDFGSGYSSLSYLKQLPATEIKLDRSLIIDVCTSESSKMIVETAINMAHGLGYEIVAEGVEDKETAFLLKEMGCDMLQGYWLCRPLPLEKLQSWLAESRDVL